MKKIICAIIMCFSLQLFSQDCNTPYQYCPGITTIPLSQSNQNLNGPQYGCISGFPNSATFIWFKINTPGNLLFHVASSDTADHYVGSACWGPLASPYSACNNITSGNMVDCSNSNADTLSINNAMTGQYYVVCVSGYWTAAAQNLVMTQIGGTGSIACTTPICNMYNPGTVCFVSADSVPNNEIYFNHSLSGLKGTIVYRKNSIGTWDSIGYVPSSQPDKFIDPTANPNQLSYSYCIAQMDSCGNLRAKTAAHTTVLLQSSLGTSGQVNLSWNAYIGITVPYYYIYRGSSPNSMTLLTQVSSTNYAYTDLSPLPGVNYYKVAIPAPAGCSSNAAHDTLVSSNYRTNGVTSISHVGNSLQTNIYPNPAKNELYIQTPEVSTQIEITDILGKVLLVETLTASTQSINIQNLVNGIYFAKITDSKGTYSRKFLIEH